MNFHIYFLYLDYSKGGKSIENEKLELIEKKLKINKIFHIVSISVSALAIVLLVMALSGNFIGKGNNRRMMRHNDMRQERMMMGGMDDGYNRGGRLFMQNDRNSDGRKNKPSSKNQMNSNKDIGRSENRTNKNTKESSKGFRRNNNSSSSNNNKSSPNNSNNVPQNNDAPIVERNNQPMAPNMNNQIVPQ